jgi:hypothetical protein
MSDLPSEKVDRTEITPESPEKAPSIQIRSSGIQTPDDPHGIINPPHRRRLLILLCFPLVFLLGVPFWWWSTSIERLSLPVDRIAALEAAPVCLYTPLKADPLGYNNTINDPPYC